MTKYEKLFETVTFSNDVKVKGTNKSFPEYYRAALRGYCPVYIGSNVLTANDALAAVIDADGVYVGRGFLMDPDFVQKIADNRPEAIVNTSTLEKLKEVGLPNGFVENYADKDGSTRVVSYRNGIPLPGSD